MAMIPGIILSMFIEDPSLNYQVQVVVKYSLYWTPYLNTDPVPTQILDFQNPVRPTERHLFLEREV